jgi:hypothetical protein
MRMKSDLVFLKQVSFMKRFLLSGVLLLAMGRTAFCYTNDAVVQVPTMNPELIQLDDPVFVNNGYFSYDGTIYQLPPIEASIPYETSSTLTYINNGTMFSIPGFDFEYFPASVGQAHMAANFINNGNGFGGGQIIATNVFGLILPIIKVRATNIVDSGLMTMDNSGLIDIAGVDVNLDRARMIMTGGNTFSNTTSGITALDYGWGVFGSNSLSQWFPAFDLTPTTALTPFFLSTLNPNILLEQMFLSNAVVYFQDLNPQPGADGIIVWRGIYLQDNSPSSVTKNVFFDAAGIGGGAFHIEWVGTYREPTTGLLATNFFYLSDVPVNRRGTNNLPFPFPPDFSFAEGPTRLIPANTQFATPGYANPAPFDAVTNDYSYINIKPNAVLLDTNTVVGGSVTNLTGRIQLAASNSMNLDNIRVVGPNYFRLDAAHNLASYSNAVIFAPYSDLNIGRTDGSITLSNLLVPALPSWSGVPDAPSAVQEFVVSGNVIGFVPAPMGGIQAWSGSYIFVDANGVTNDVRMLLVNSALQPTSPALQQNVAFHASDNLVISDALNIFGNFSSDATTLTLTTNANSAYSLAGELNLLSPNILVSASLPNLKYLTNWGRITTKNLANFAGNMPSPFSPRGAATPYEAFVNHGTINDQGIFVRANYFENSGLLQEFPNGGIDLNITSAAIITNSTLSATNGPISIAANSLLVSNSFVSAGRTLTLNVPCMLSDGYVFGNQFGHVTNATLPGVVTNGNTWVVGGGVQILVKPPTADLLGTTISNISLNSLDSINLWPGDDRGCSPAGFAENLALGRMILSADAQPSRFTFVNIGGNHALYVDSIEFQGSITNTDATGNFTGINIQPGMKIYYAQALMNGVSIAEKLNGKNGGGFCWVSNYAGIYSSTNLNGTLYNAALVISPSIDSDNDTVVNVNDPTPIPAGLTFDIANAGPIACGGGGGGGTDQTNSPVGPGNHANTIDTLAFPAHHTTSTGTGSVSFAQAQGVYNGLFYETNAVDPASSGFFTAKVTGKGKFTAKLQLGGKTYSISDTFNSAGTYVRFVKNSPGLTVTLHLVNNDEIIGEVSDGSWTAQLLALRSLNQGAAFGVGKHSLVLSTDDANSTTPSGDTIGTMNLAKNGDIQWSGTLPDGVKVSQKSALSKDGVWPLYSSLYGGSGSLLGWLQVTNGTSDIGGSAVWITPANQNALHPNGLTNELKAAGSSVNNSSATTHRTLILSGPSLSSPLTNDVTISGKTGQSGNNNLTLSVDVKNGLFNGSVVDPDSSQTLLFQGALLEKSGTGGGFFLNANKDQGGKVSLTPAN